MAKALRFPCDFLAIEQDLIFYNRSLNLYPMPQIVRM